MSSSSTATSEIVGLERAALDRWGNGDPDGFLELYAPDISYFDPITAARIDGHAAMAEYYRPWAGKIRVSRYELINPKVVVTGEMALLTYNLVNFFVDANGSEAVGSRWNSTVVYQQQGGAWKSIHSHWSFTEHPAFRTVTVASSERQG